MRWIVIALTLFAYWLLLSGHYYPWLIALGGSLSLVVAVYCGYRGVTDPEGFPLRLLGRALIYWPWLAWQIVLSALRVTRLVIAGKGAISPTMVRVEALQKTDLGLTVYANSITLTPGTLSVDVSGRRGIIWVHAIERAGAEGFADDEMNRRVAWFETGSR